jgi:DNA protecting protein DprA
VRKIDMEEERILRCALSGVLVYKPKILNELFDKYGEARKIYGLSGEKLMREMNLREELVKQIFSRDIIEWAKSEVDWADEKGIHLLFRGDEKYPKLLMECEDAPQMLYYKGVADLNKRAIGIVGTRLASNYGRECCSRIVDDLCEYNPLIVSGLAFGIDVCAHKEALEKGLETVAVLPNGLDSIYPQKHRDVAVRMVKNGGLLTEFPRTMQAQKINFIKRNRIIAGLSQAIVIVESRVKGGAMTTVEFANMYNREVFALPGRITDTNSYGCNYLISKNVANIYNAQMLCLVL